MRQFNSSDELLSEAKSITSEAPADLKESVEPYFISRYFVAIYEARNGEIPIQVWNEYRNALDHLFRYLVSSEKSRGQVNSAHKHFLRAALDILKLHAHKTQDSIIKLKKSYEPKVLDLVDNGDFIKSLDKDIEKAVKMFEDAKINDLQLGDDSNKNSFVLKEYLDVAFAFEKIKKNINTKQSAIENAKSQYGNIHNKGQGHSLFSGIVIHLFSMAIGAGLLAAYENYSNLYGFIVYIFTPS